MYIYIVYTFLLNFNFLPRPNIDKKLSENGYKNGSCVCTYVYIRT